MPPAEEDESMKEGKPGATDSIWEKVVRDRVAGFIRMKSRAGQLSLREEILEELAQQNETSEVLDALVSKTLEENGDLREVSLRCGAPRYYSCHFMTDAFVKILLRKERDPLLLLAQTIRENSQIYPRPIPLDAFKDYPFNLTEAEILTCLGQMTEADQYQDIQRTATSTGTVFLYSTLHLDPGHAGMLAEWLDVGQFNNP